MDTADNKPAVPGPHTRLVRFDVLTTACILESQLGELEQQCQEASMECEEKRQRLSVLEDELQVLLSRELCEKEVTSNLKRTWTQMENVCMEFKPDSLPGYDVREPDISVEEGSAFAPDLSLPSVYSDQGTTPTLQPTAVIPLCAAEPVLETLNDASEPPHGPIENKVLQHHQSDPPPMKSNSISFITDLPIARAIAAFTEGVRPQKAMFDSAIDSPIEYDTRTNGLTAMVFSRKASRKRRSRNKKMPSKGATSDLNGILATNSTILNAVHERTINETTMPRGSWKKGIIERSLVGATHKRFSKKARI